MLQVLARSVKGTMPWKTITGVTSPLHSLSDTRTERNWPLIASVNRRATEERQFHPFHAIRRSLFCAYTSVTFDPSHQRASLLLSSAVSAICELLTLEISGDAQAPDFSVA